MGKEQDLLDASRNGQLAVVEKILSARFKKSGPLNLARIPGPNTTDPRNGFSCLHYAALNGHKDIVRFLLQNGANPNVIDHKGATALHLASWTGDYEVVNLLIQSKANANPTIDLNAANNDRETALHLASQYGHSAVVSLLLNSGSNPFVRNVRQESPLDLAAQYGRLETVELLLRLRPDLLKEYASRSHRPSPEVPPHSPLHLASRNGHRRIVRLLLDLGFDIDLVTLSGSALHEAALCGKAEVVKLLLEAGIDVTIENDRRQKVEDLLNELATPHAKQIKNIIREFVTSGYISPVDSTTMATSLCEVSEDMTLVESMLQEDASFHQNDFDLLRDDEDDIQCISPPPGYCDFAPDSGPSNLDLLQPELDRISPASSVFSTSILSELASIFGDQLANVSRLDDQANEPQATEPFPQLKCSTSFSCSNKQSRIGEASSLDANTFNLDKQCQDLKASDFSIVSARTNSPSMPAKPPRKSVTRLSPAKVKSVDDLDSDQSQCFNSVISNDKKLDKKKSSAKSTGYLVDSIDDFATLYDIVASGKEIEFAKPPSPKTAESQISDVIRPLKEQLVKHSEEALQNRVLSPEQPRCLTDDDDIGRIEKRDISTLTDEFGCDEILAVLIPENEPKKHRSVAVWTVLEGAGHENRSTLANRVQVKKKQLDSPRRRSTPASSGSGRRRVDDAAGCHGWSVTAENGRKEQFGAYCETLKLDRKGELNNPFAGLCRGGLSPAVADAKAVSRKARPDKAPTNDSSSSVTGNNGLAKGSGSGSARKKKHVELSEARKEMRRQRAMLSGRAQSHSLSHRTSSTCDATSASENEHKVRLDAVQRNDPNNIYATLRKKKKAKSLNGDHLGNALVPIDIDESTLKGVKSSDSCDNLLKRTKSESRSVKAIHDLYRWLKDIGMENYHDLLVSNGYDDLDFMDSNVMDDSDLLEIGIINASHRESILYAAQRLPKSTPKLSKAEIKLLNVQEWLAMLHLERYAENFVANGMTELRKIHNTGDMELESVLEIDKSGYRRRILYSLSDYNRQSILIDDDDLSSWLTDVQSANEADADAKSGRCPSRVSPRPDTRQSAGSSWTGWKHSRTELVSNCVQYSVSYLGSTHVRELRGIDSTRASMAKLKNQQPVRTTAIPKIVLSISCKGVQFKDFKSNLLICEHEIRNIHCICQDSEDLNYFGYITKDMEANSHYCHVFMSAQTDLVTEIILTLGQAFEIAYQIVLEQYNTQLAQVNAEVGHGANALLTSVSHSSSNSNFSINYGLDAKTAKVNRDDRSRRPDTAKGQSSDRSELVSSSVDDDIVGEDDEIRNAFANCSNAQSTIVEKKHRTKSGQVDTLCVGHSTEPSSRGLVQRTPTPPQRSASLKRNQGAKLSLCAVPIADQSSREEPSNPPPPPLRQASRENTLKSQVNFDRKTALGSASLSNEKEAFSSSQDIYAVVDKSRKLKSSQGAIGGGSDNGQNEGETKPRPPTRSTSTAGRKPEIKPKPPARNASITRTNCTAQKPEVKPKPRTLAANAFPLAESASTVAVARPGISIKPSIAARQAALVNACSSGNSK